MMQVEDERRHADQYKEQVLTHDEQIDLHGKICFPFLLFCQFDRVTIQKARPLTTFTFLSDGESQLSYEAA